jgi:DNA-binding beta-propeller fold protein YncE
MSARRLVSAAVVSLCALVGVLQLWSAPALAAKVHVFGGSFGEPCSAGGPCGNGQFNAPAGVAVNESTGDVYVVDRGDNRVELFNSAGAYVSQFNGSAAPTGPLSSPEAIAVDNSTNPLDPSAGDVYVTGEVVVGGQTRHVIYKFSGAGIYEGQLDTGEKGTLFAELYGVAVDSAGELWVYYDERQI